MRRTANSQNCSRNATPTTTPEHTKSSNQSNTSAATAPQLSVAEILARAPPSRQASASTFLCPDNLQIPGVPGKCYTVTVRMPKCKWIYYTLDHSEINNSSLIGFL